MADNLTENLLLLKRLKEASVQCMNDILKELCSLMSSDVFNTIYKKFRPNIDYKWKYFKIANVNYLEYI